MLEISSLMARFVASPEEKQIPPPMKIAGPVIEKKGLIVKHRLFFMHSGEPEAHVDLRSG
jgi:hypothetical protein